MTRLVSLIAVMLVVSGAGFAKPMDQPKAARAVRTWLARNATPMDTSLGSRVKGIQTYRDSQGQPLYHVAALDPAGFVIISADDLVEPIIAFSSSGSYSASPRNPLGALIEGDARGRLADARAADKVRSGPAARHRRARYKWNRLTSDEPISDETPSGAGGVTDVRASEPLP